MKLSELQQNFQQYIFNPELTQIASAVSLPPTDSILDRLAIYADGYEGRLGEALEKTFSALIKYSGDDNFYAWCSEYIHLYPSSFFSIARMGGEFSIFLKNKSLLLESEIASLEWAINTAVDAGDALPITKQDLEKISQEKWGDIILECHPSLQILKFSVNTLEIYKAVLDNQETIPEVKIFSQIEICRVWRKERQVYYLSLHNPVENLFLECIQQKLTFSEICEKLAEQMSEDEVVNYAIGQILTWLQDELITGIKVSHELA